MKITNVETFTAVGGRFWERSPLEEGKPYVGIYIPYPEHTVKVMWKHRGVKTTFVKISTDEGIYGIGECKVVLAPQVTSLIIQELLKPILIGKDPFDVDAIWEYMYGLMKYRGQVKGFMLEAISGVDIALWDIIGKATNKPVHKLLGGCFRDRIDAYASSILWGKTEDVVETALKLVEDGHKAIKLKGGRGVQKDVENIKAIRQAIGNDVELMLDANCAYDFPTALKLGRKLERYDIYWFEEPISPEQIDDYVRLTKALDVPIATGENEFTRWGFRDIITKRAADIIMPDIGRAGGISECKKIASMANAFGILYSPHTGVVGAGIKAASIHLSAAIPNFLTYEYFWESNPLTDEILVEPIEKFERGYIKVPDKPGLGIEIKEDILSKYLIK